jgi:hypothetical protein
MLCSPSGIHYVFLLAPHDIDRKYRAAELGGRCFIARGLNPNSQRVIGIATEQPEPGKGFSFDIFYLHQPNWTAEDQRRMEYAQKQFGWFSNSTASHFKADEYPIT